MYDTVINNQGNVTSTDEYILLGAACLKAKLGILFALFRIFSCRFLFLFCFVCSLLLVMVYFGVCPRGFGIGLVKKHRRSIVQSLGSFC